MNRKPMVALSVMALIALSPALAGCDRPQSKWEMCLEAGGTPKDHGFGTDCYMPGEKAD